MSTRDLSSLECLTLIAMQILTGCGAGATVQSSQAQRAELGDDFSVLEHHNGPTRWVAGAKADNRLYGLDGDTGALITVTDVDGFVTTFSTPIAAKGRIYLGVADQLLAFSLN